MASTESSKSPKTLTAASSCREFAYQALSQKGPAGDSPNPLKPAVPMLVRHPSKDQTYPLSALIDSGADASSFPDEWASALGIDLDECRAVRVKTASGVTYHPQWSETLEVTIADRTFPVRPRFAPIQVAVLGRRDFFLQFKIEIDERARVTRLTAYDSLSTNRSVTPGS
jgi:hypothetical protein